MKPSYPQNLTLWSKKKWYFPDEGSRLRLQSPKFLLPAHNFYLCYYNLNSKNFRVAFKLYSKNSIPNSKNLLLRHRNGTLVLVNKFKLDSFFEDFIAFQPVPVNYLCSDFENLFFLLIKNAEECFRRLLTPPTPFVNPPQQKNFDFQGFFPLVISPWFLSPSKFEDKCFSTLFGWWSEWGRGLFRVSLDALLICVPWKFIQVFFEDFCYLLTTSLTKTYYLFA